MFGHRRWAGGMIKYTISEHYHFVYPGRNQDGRDADSQAIEVETKDFVLEFVRRARRWFHVVVDSPMLVIHDEQRRTFPQLLVASNRFVHFFDEALPRHHVVVRMLVGGRGLPIFHIVVGIVWFDEAIGRQFSGFAVVAKIIQRAEQCWLFL